MKHLSSFFRSSIFVVVIRQTWQAGVGDVGGRRRWPHVLPGVAPALGLQLLEKALNARGTSVEAIPKKKWKRFLKEHHMERQEDLFHDLALGSTLAFNLSSVHVRSKNT